MKEICDYIDAYIQANLSCPGFKFFGISELAIKANQPSPVTINNREQVSINDRYDGIVYHRLLTPLSGPESAEFSFGSKMSFMFGAKIRTVLAFKVGRFEEEFLIDFVNAMPNKSVIIAGYKMINAIENLVINTDQPVIYTQEFGTANDYEKHILNWNIYAIEYENQFIKC